MILLFTDFGAEGPYVGQIEAAIHQICPEHRVINLVSNAPPTEPRLGAYLLAALARNFPRGSIFLCVVDPGVGGQRLPVVLEADERWFVGPDNGLLNSVAVQAGEVRWRQIEWRPENLSNSFHGRDLFAPVAARIARRDFAWTAGLTKGPDLAAWPADIAAIIYFDHFGNAVTGCRYSSEWEGKTLLMNGRRLQQAGTFCDVPEGQAFWYCNSMGLIEIAANRGRAQECLKLSLGMGFRFDE
jgi:hypothetical protein